VLNNKLDAVLLCMLAGITGCAGVDDQPSSTPMADIERGRYMFEIMS
jgi:hypothetical protein